MVVRRKLIVFRPKDNQIPTAETHMLHRDHTGRVLLIVSGGLAFLGGAALSATLTPAPPQADRVPVATIDALRATTRTTPTRSRTALPDSPLEALDLTQSQPSLQPTVHVGHWTLKPTPAAR